MPRLRPEVCARVEAVLFPAVLGLPTARVRAAARRAVAVADPDEVTERAERARADRFVLVRPGLDPGMTEWVAEQPAETSAAAWAAIDELAHSYVADGEHRSLDQARADAMIDLILGQATITTTVDLNLPLTALPRPDGAALPRPGDAAGLDDAGLDVAGVDAAGLDDAGLDAAGARRGRCRCGPGRWVLLRWGHRWGHRRAGRGDRAAAAGRGRGCPGSG